ncbi:MAG: ATP-dependent DNA helicase [Acidimicrobiia bacterium]
MSLRETRVAPEDWDLVIPEGSGYQLVVAGPGTGKTEFLVRRVAHLIQSGRARRDQVSVLTFSRRAAADIKGRVQDLLGRSGIPIQASTFHSLALRLLETGSGGTRPVPLTTPEQVSLVGELLRAEDPEQWPLIYRGILDTPAFAAEIADFLMRCSERLLSPDDLSERARSRADWRGIPGLFRKYRDLLASIDRTDYGTMLVSAVSLLTTTQGKELASGFEYVVVDEYQDTSPAQAELARLLALPGGNLTVAGDPYQSIYSFRGAEVRNVAEFTETHPSAHRIVLTKSQRVPAEILSSALRVVSGGDLPGAAGPVEAADHVGLVQCHIFDQETAEAEWIAKDIEHAIRVENKKPSDVAVLVRSKRQMLNQLSRALTRRHIPHDAPDSRLVEHPAIRLVHDLVIAATSGGSIPVVSPGEAAEADQAMRRIMLGPLVSAGLGQERQILRDRRRTWDPWPEVVARALPSHPNLAALLEDPAWALDRPAIDGFWHVWNSLEGIDSIVNDPARSDWRLALTSFSQVLDRQAERDSSVTLLGYFRLTEEDGFESEPLLSFQPHGDRVTLTTLHQAKGLEFDVVYIANAVEGVFPDLTRGRRMLRPELLSPERTTDPSAQSLFQVQEEMRLAYTAMTRAKNRVVWTATEAGVDQGEHRPSRFLLAAAGPGAARPGPPVEEERPAVTIGEAEVQLRRTMLDPAAAALDRLVALEVLTSAPRVWWESGRFAGVPAPGPDRPILPESIRLSPSQADGYTSCPRRYALERRMRLGNSTSPYAQFGTLVHAALERAERENLGTGASHAPLEDALRQLEAVWGDADFGTPQLNEAWLRHAREAMTKLYENWPTPDGIPLEVERRVEMTVDGVPWLGYIDRLERAPKGLRVIDYKTSKNAPTIADAGQSIQLGFYAAAVTDEMGEPVVEAEMWFPRTNAKTVSVRKLDMSHSDDLRQVMEEVTRAITSETWEPRVSDRCMRCDFRLSCPAWPEGKGAFVP